MCVYTLASDKYKHTPLVVLRSLPTSFGLGSSLEIPSELSFACAVAPVRGLPNHSGDQGAEAREVRCTLRISHIAPFWAL